MLALVSVSRLGTLSEKKPPSFSKGMGELTATRIDVENHMIHNKGNKLEIPAHVPGWLEEVVKVDAEVNSIISSNVGTCFSFKTRHTVGKKASELIEVIKRLTEEHSRIVWDNLPIPYGKVDSMKASTSAPSVEYHSDFDSREETFQKALEALEVDHKSHMIALCGMGGVGKTTMMKQLKTVVQEKRMFSLIVEVAIGEKTDLLAIQKAVAESLRIDLQEETKSVRAAKLRGWFANYSEGGKKKILVILDDIWQLVDPNDIGLSPLPNQGVNFKVMLTSRSRDVCTTMGVEANSIFNLKVLAKVEAQSFFWKFIEDSDEADLDPHFRKVGGDIVSRCQGLPIAIKTIANTLKGKSKGVWEDTLTRLQHHDIHKIVNKVFEVSYNNLEDEETKSVFLLCGLYPEDFDIPTEELVRYGWGLKLFNKVYTIREARNRLNTCIEQLLDTNLLIESNHAGCIKMHDLVLAFILKMYSKVEHASIINHGDMSEWSANDTLDSCKRISFACNGMEEFPRDFKYPNLSFLKLTQGDKSLRFPENFYGLMEKLQVIVYENMQYPLLPRSLEYSTNLRTLCLHGCSLMFDCHYIGSLLNLEVLSFANCSVQKLPSTIGNLKQLKLLDLTGCFNLHIDDGVLENLVKLEELYMKVSLKVGISFTDRNINELAERSKKLCALEIEFFRNNVQPKRMSFKNLERFKISIGCFLEMEDEKTTSFENKLMLVSNKIELLESRINDLFEKTVVLHLEVDGMNDLEDFRVKSLHSIEYSSFYKLRVLNISYCAQLRYLFTRRVAATLLKLEHLEVLSCYIMKTLIHDEDSGSGPISFPSLKFLSLGGLPKLAGLCNNDIVIELPQLMELRLDGLPDFTSIFPDDKLASSSMLSDTSIMQPFFNEEVAIPKLETLQIRRMNKLKKIWSSKVTHSESVCFSMLKAIKVEECDRLVNLFPRNPMSWLYHLIQLSVEKCHSIKTIFKINMGCVPETRESSNSSLVSIVVKESKNLKHMWSLKNVDSSNNHIIHGFEAVGRISIYSCESFRHVWSLKNVGSSNNHIIRGFEAIESIEMHDCINFRNLFTPITADFNLKALQQIEIGYSKSMRIEQLLLSLESSPEHQNNAISRDIAFSSHLLRTFHQLRTLTLKHDREAQVVFDIESASSGELPTSQNNHLILLPSLEDLTLSRMDNMSHVWKCNWNQLFILQQPKSLCQNLTKITLNNCGSIRYLFSPLMFKFLYNLKHVYIEGCNVMEEIVSNNNDEYEEMATSTSTHTNITILERLELHSLTRLQHIGGGGGGGSCTSIYNQFQQSEEVAVARWSLCQYSRHIKIKFCSALSIAIPSYALGHMQNLEELQIWRCDSMKDVFEIKSVRDVGSCNGGEGSGGENNNSSSSVVSLTTTPQKLPNTNIMILPPDLRNLRRLQIVGCPLLRDVFPFSTLKSLTHLQYLKIEDCNDIQVIIKEEDGNHTTSEVVAFPCLKSMELISLPNLKSFFLGTNDFRWPVLDTVEIRECPKMTTFTQGRSDSPMLKYITSDMGENSVECGLNNFFHPTSALQEVPYPSLDASTSLPVPERMPWFYNNLIKVHVCSRNYQRYIIGHNELQHMLKVENLNILFCSAEREIFETFEMNNGLNQTQHSVVEVRQMDFCGLDDVKCLWKSKQWTVLKFPNLTRLSIVNCDSLKRVFTISMVGSLLQLQELHISGCREMEMILADVEKEDDEKEQNDDGKEDEDDDERRVNEDGGKEKEDDDERRVNKVEFPCLRSLTIDDLTSLKGFCLGMETIHWPSLVTLEIENCPEITTFTNGESTTPKLKFIKTSFGLCDATEGVNSFIRTKIEEGYEFSGMKIVWG